MSARNNNAELANNEIRELSINELDEVNGGFLWIAAVVVGFAVGTAARYAIDWTVDKITG